MIDNKLRTVIEKKPKDMSARLMMARLLLIDGKREEALTEATRIVADEPDTPAAADAYALIGNIQYSLDRRDEAIKAFEEVIPDYFALITTRPDIPVYRENLAVAETDLAQAWYRLGQNGEAREASEKKEPDTQGPAYGSGFGPAPLT